MPRVFFSKKSPRHINSCEKSGQKVKKKPLRIDYLKIKIRRTRTRDSRESYNCLETKTLYFLYILAVFKMTHFELQNGPF